MPTETYDIDVLYKRNRLREYNISREFLDTTTWKLTTFLIIESPMGRMFPREHKLTIENPRWLQPPPTKPRSSEISVIKAEERTLLSGDIKPRSTNNK